MAGYYPIFILVLKYISSTLHLSTSIIAVLKWNPEMKEVFKSLNHYMNSPPVMDFPKFEKMFIVETDSFAFALVVYWHRRRRIEDRTLSIFSSRPMNQAEKNYRTCDREALSVIFSVKTFRVYLLSVTTITLITDHQALIYTFQIRNIYVRLTFIWTSWPSTTLRGNSTS